MADKSISSDEIAVNLTSLKRFKEKMDEEINSKVGSGGGSGSSSTIDILESDPSSPETGYMWITQSTS
jgi:hypothetical protein